jgi:glyoxylase-like metal-dependent hydrolase (beta-lactamase superfamily II)
MRNICQILAVLLGVLSLPAQAFDTVKVNERVYALVGELGQRSPENLGHNMTSGFIIGDEAVAVVDPGACRKDAQRIEQAIRAVTDKPIRWVINTGAQDHRWLGNAWFKQRGAHIVAAQAARDYMEAQAERQLEGIRKWVGVGCDGTEAVLPDVTYTGRHSLDLKGVDVELIFTGGAHTPGDAFVWIPEQKVLFTGDTVYVQRLLGVLPNGLGRWLTSLEFMRNQLKPVVVIPGHGHVTDLDEAMRDTYGYLIMLRDAVTQRIEDGAFDPVEAAQGLDQSEFSYLENYDQLSFRAMNAQRVAEELFETAQ